MTRHDESAIDNADHVVQSTRRSRRDGERDAAHRALYAAVAEPSSPMRVVDGGAPMYRTRREMRESASRLASDLPVIVEPTEQSNAGASATVTERAASSPAVAQRPHGQGSRRARRAMRLADDAPVTPDLVEPALQTIAQPVPSPSTAPPSTRRDRRVAVSAAARADEMLDGRSDDQTPVTKPDVAATLADAVEVSTSPPVTAEASTQPTSSAPPEEGAVTRAGRRTVAVATSAEGAAAVVGGEMEDAASTPVRSPLRREARPPRPATVVRRPVVTAPVVRPSRRARSSAARRAVQRLGAAGVILAIGSFVVVTSLPAQAFSPSGSSIESGASAEQAYGDVQVQQQLDVSSNSDAHGDEEVTAVLSREDFNVNNEVTSTQLDTGELAALQGIADGEAIGPYYGGDSAMPNLWPALETSYTQSPFPSLAEVPVSSGFGYRWGSFHGGVDLIPGAGTPIYPIANGVVVAVWQGNNPGGGGYQVIVEHNIDGQFFQSWYPHMQAGSILVEEGQVVDISTQLGAVGSTGRSTGAHLHLEIKNSDYISVDPLVWLATRQQILEP